MVARIDKSGPFWALILIVLLGTAPILAQQRRDVTSEQVIAAQQRGVAWLRGRQGANGSWERGGRGGGIQRGGGTALCLLALLNAGVPPGDPAIAMGIRYLNEVPHRSTYVVSLQSQVYAAANPKRYARQLRAAAKFLISSQKPNGMWTYTKGPGSGGDNSNTQFALLGLHEAHQGGAPVPGRVWKQSRDHFINTQNPDGGWGYRGRGGKSYGSMTAAGLASLYICGQRLMVSIRGIFKNGAYPGCGRYRRNRVLGKGIEWITQNFSVRTNPGKRAWLYYWLYGLERVGMISGLRNFGDNDWYRSGAAELVATQRPAGNWGDSRQTHDTAFALLFLGKGNRPVIIQKVKWPGHWNRNLHDLENLTRFIGQKMERGMGWQTTSLELPLEELRTSPILFITGHKFPVFTPEQTDKLRRFLTDAGGTLLFEACCGRKDFIAGFRQFALEAWPDRPLSPLQKDHSIYSCVFPIEDTYGLEGIDIGCRTGVFFSTRALSCLWELRKVPKYSKLAFQLGTNLTAYATGGDRLRNRLDVVELPDTPKQTDDRRMAEVPRGAVRIARLIHDGKYDLNPNAMPNLAAMLRDQAGIDVVARSRHGPAGRRGRGMALAKTGGAGCRRSRQAIYPGPGRRHGKRALAYGKGVS